MLDWYNKGETILLLQRRPQPRSLARASWSGGDEATDHEVRRRESLYMAHYFSEPSLILALTLLVQVDNSLVGDAWLAAGLLAYSASASFATTTTILWQNWQN